MDDREASSIEFRVTRPTNNRQAARERSTVAEYEGHIYGLSTSGDIEYGLHGLFHLRDKLVILLFYCDHGRQG